MVCLAGLKRRTLEWKFIEFISSVGAANVTYKVCLKCSVQKSNQKNQVEEGFRESKAILRRDTLKLQQVKWNRDLQQGHMETTAVITLRRRLIVRSQLK